MTIRILPDNPPRLQRDTITAFVELRINPSDLSYHLVEDLIADQLDNVRLSAVTIMKELVNVGDHQRTVLRKIRGR